MARRCRSAAAETTRRSSAGIVANRASDLWQRPGWSERLSGVQTDSRWNEFGKIGTYKSSDREWTQAANEETPRLFGRGLQTQTLLR